ncbi:SDR family oxidoreductase [Nocardia arizonensis]|nr:SDR family oxidoreductase [Nocardia arizonensis]
MNVAPTEAAVEAMTFHLAVEYAARGIRVNIAAADRPVGPVADQSPDADAMRRAITAATALRRLGTAEDFAEVVAFLASPRASWSGDPRRRRAVHRLCAALAAPGGRVRRRDRGAR